MTKLDGSAKGGIIFAIANELEIPFRYIGIGEGIADLEPFNAAQFLSAIFNDDHI
jgi:fused signal recognition particle receptor